MTKPSLFPPPTLSPSDVQTEPFRPHVLGQDALGQGALGQVVEATSEAATTVDEARADETGADEALANASVLYQQKQQWQQARTQALVPSAADVERALSKQRLDLDDLRALLSPAAANYLEPMLAAATHAKRRYQGNTLKLFAPVYLSNLCSNECSYCGFSRSNAVKRRQLTVDEALREAEAVKQSGIHSLLLVTGEHARKAGAAYLAEVTTALRPQVAQLMLESQPLSLDEYRWLRQCGIDGVMLYQETYDVASYQRHHSFGKKADMANRLQAPTRVLEAGIATLGMGVLLGLSDWRADVWCLAAHLSALKQQFYQASFSVALPRLQPCEGNLQQHSGVTDRQYLQLLCALKLYMPELQLTISTRDSPALRDLLLPTIASSASAGSKTQPGGYVVAPQSLAQFAIDDTRSPKQIIQMLHSVGISAVTQDWHAVLGRDAL